VPFPLRIFRGEGVKPKNIFHKKTGKCETSRFVQRPEIKGSFNDFIQ
jgi:hypothetical protein